MYGICFKVINMREEVDGSISETRLAMCCKPLKLADGNIILFYFWIYLNLSIIKIKDIYCGLDTFKHIIIHYFVLFCSPVNELQFSPFQTEAFLGWSHPCPWIGLLQRFPRCSPCPVLPKYSKCTNPLNSHNHSVLTLVLALRWGNWVTESLSNFPKSTQLVRLNCPPVGLVAPPVCAYAILL